MGDLPDFGEIRFSGTLRPSQVAASSVIVPQLEHGEKRLHIVAPPGSGKTVLGLYVWADLVRKPALVLSPNSAIQAQWAARTSLFDLDGKDEFISTDPKKPGLLTSLTYQSVTMPRKGGEDLDEVAIELWAEKLILDEEASDHEEAKAWQDDLLERNFDYYTKRLSTYRKKVRDEFAEHGNALWTLHESAKENLLRLKEVGIGLIILDECHHLMHHWGRVLSEVREMFDDPVILGLTATPPGESGFKESDVKRYEEFFGPVDYSVPVPALVRDSNLAPYQDLCYFVRPASHELQYIAGVDQEFETLLSELRETNYGADVTGLMKQLESNLNTLKQVESKQQTQEATLEQVEQRFQRIEGGLEGHGRLLHTLSQTQTQQGRLLSRLNNKLDVLTHYATGKPGQPPDPEPEEEPNDHPDNEPNTSHGEPEGTGP